MAGKGEIPPGIMDGPVAKTILNSVKDGIYAVDQDLRIVFWNQGAARISGYSSEDVLGKACSANLLVHVDETGKSLCDTSCPLKTSLSKRQEVKAKAYLHHKAGFRLPVTLHALPLLDPEGTPRGAVQIFQEIVPKFAMPQRKKDLEQMQLLDALTQVGNRRFLEIHLQSRLEELKKYRLPFGVIYADVDRLKNINATYGASVGDQVLHMVAQTFANNIRFFDLIGRWESDEFVVAVTNVDSNTLDLVANKLRLLVEKSGLMADEAMVRATVSLGAVPAHRVDDVETMLAKARELMRRSKWLGRNAVSLPQADENEPF